MARTSAAYIDHNVSSVVSQFQVAKGWTRTIARADSNGTVLNGVLLEPARTTKTHYSAGYEAGGNDIAGNWNQYDPGDTFQTAAVTDPRNLGQATQIIADATNDYHFIYSDANYTLTAATYTQSSVVKDGNMGWYAQKDEEGPNSGQYWDLDTPALGTSRAGVIDTAIEDWGNGWYLCWQSFTGAAVAGDSQMFPAEDDVDVQYAGDGASVNTWWDHIQVELGAFPSSRIDATTADATRAADGDLEYDIGSAIDSGVGSITFKFLSPEHAPGAETELLRLTEGAGDYLKCSVTTDGYLKVDSAKTAGSAGSVTVSKNICDGEIYECRVLFQDDSLKANVRDVATSTITSGTEDTSCDMPTGMDTIEFKPSGYTVGEFALYDEVTTLADWPDEPVADTAVKANRQYRPISTYETGTDDPLSVRFVRDMTDNLNNYVRFVGNHKLCGMACVPEWVSHPSETDERVVWASAPRVVPDGYSRLTWIIRHYRKSGANNVVWRLYCSSNPYRGPIVMDTDYLPVGYSSGSITTTGNYLKRGYNQEINVVKAKSGNTYFTLTAEAGENSQGAITSIDIWPHEIAFMLEGVTFG